MRSPIPQSVCPPITKNQQSEICREIIKFCLTQALHNPKNANHNQYKHKNDSIPGLKIHT